VKPAVIRPLKEAPYQAVTSNNITSRFFVYRYTYVDDVDVCITINEKPLFRMNKTLYISEKKYLYLSTVWIIIKPYVEVGFIAAWPCRKYYFVRFIAAICSVNN